MSIASEIERLQRAKANIIEALVTKGVMEEGETISFDDIASKILEINN